MYLEWHWGRNVTLNSENMSTKKGVTKKQLEKYLDKLIKYRDEQIQPLIESIRVQLNTTPFSTTPPGPAPKNPPGIP